MTHLQTISQTLGVILSTCALIAIIVRVILVPYLREHLVKPVARVETQVTEHPEHPLPAEEREPTLRDDLRDVREDLRHINRYLETHVEWSQERAARIEREIGDLRETAADHAAEILHQRERIGEHDQQIAGHAVELTAQDRRIAALEADRHRPPSG